VTFSSMPVGRGDIISSALKIVKECTSHPRVIALSGPKVKEPISSHIQKELTEQVKLGKILELEGCPFGLLFDRLDALCVHGGLGTTAEAMRAGIPTTVVGVLLMDQRFWGQQCESLGIGGPMCHIASFKKKCVGVVDAMLAQDSPMKSMAKELSKKIQPKSPDGVPENVAAIVKALEAAVPINTGSGFRTRYSLTASEMPVDIAVGEDESSAVEKKTSNSSILHKLSGAARRGSVPEVAELSPEAEATEFPHDDANDVLL